MNENVMCKLEALEPRSAWSKGVKAYALELVEDAQVDLTRDNALEELLNGADDWSAYSWGGCAYIYDGDIVEMLCTPGELKLFNNGKLIKPNAHEEWLDTQGRALQQAYGLIMEHLEGDLC